ncbi:hypothetical protein WDU94_003613 [Cyamophila willieti]
MLERFLKLAEKVGPILLKHDRAPSMVTGQDIKVIKEIISVLKPLEIATRDVSGDSYCSSSRIIPLINILSKKMDQVICETPVGIQLRNALAADFMSNRRFGNTEANRILSIATILDPRFKKIHFRNIINVSNAVDKIKQEMKDLQGVPGGQGEDSDMSEHDFNDEDDLWTLHNKIQREKSTTYRSSSITEMGIM